MTVSSMKFQGYLGCCSMLLFLLFLFPNYAHCGDIVETLPGFSGPLPFKLETGYIGVEDSELFYYFIESTGQPRIDPLILYLVGGPGCSGLNGLFFQAGPLEFNITDYEGGLPQLVLTPYTWTKTASIIFIDAPVGTGFSYSTTAEGYQVSDTSTARQNYIFLRKWLIEHPEYITNRVFLATDSYGGMYAPIISRYILDDNAAGIQPHINLVGFLSGSPEAKNTLQLSSWVPFGHRMGLISDKLYKAAKESCNGWYYDPDPSNAKCVEAVELIDQCLEDLNKQNILKPKCDLISPKPDDEPGRRAMMEAEKFLNPSLKSNQDWWCKDFHYILSDIWTNRDIVQEALHVRKGTVQQWYRCNITVTDEYIKDIGSNIPYQKNLTDTGLQILLYTGDHDMVISHVSTETWLKTLNLTVDDSWQPWYVDGEVAGYKVKYSNSGYRLTYATLKGSGHSPTEYFRGKCFQMFERWIHFYPL